MNLKIYSAWPAGWTGLLGLVWAGWAGLGWSGLARTGLDWGTPAQTLNFQILTGI